MQKSIHCVQEKITNETEIYSEDQKGRDNMLLKDTKEKQIVLNQNLLTKQLSITVYNKKTEKKITYINPKKMCVLFAQCL